MYVYMNVYIGKPLKNTALNVAKCVKSGVFKPGLELV